MQLVSAPPQGPLLDTWAHPGAGRRQENQLRELILYPTLCYPTLLPAPNVVDVVVVLDVVVVELVVVLDVVVVDVAVAVTVAVVSGRTKG